LRISTFVPPLFNERLVLNEHTRINGRTSTQPAIAHSFLITSANLFTPNGLATVLVTGKLRGNLLKPYAIPTSSIRSHSWKMSGRVGGTSTNNVSFGSVEDGVACIDIRPKRSQIVDGSSGIPKAALM
jgi:hypothetical protein